MYKTGETNCSRQRAFTLVEVLAVVIIMGIIAGLTIMMSGNDEIYYAAGTARTVEQIIEYAQQEAVRKQLYIIVYFFPDVEYVVFMGGTVSGTTFTSKPLSVPFGTNYSGNIFINLQEELRPGAYIGSVNFGSGSQSMCFTPTGEPVQFNYTTPISDSNYIIVGYGSETFKLSIKPVTGTVRTTKYN